MEDLPMADVIRWWREVALVPRDSGQQHNEARRLLDELNAKGVGDRELLMAASMLGLNAFHEWAQTQGIALDQMLEAMLREFIEQTD